MVGFFFERRSDQNATRQQKIQLHNPKGNERNHCRCPTDQQEGVGSKEDHSGSSVGRRQGGNQGTGKSDHPFRSIRQTNLEEGKEVTFKEMQFCVEVAIAYDTKYRTIRANDELALSRWMYRVHYRIGASGVDSIVP